MKWSKVKRGTAFAVAAALLCASGCGPAMKEWSPERKRVGYGMAYRKTAPEPVYNRLRWVHLPEVLPARATGEATAPMILPVVHLDLKNATLEEASRILASTARFNSYCSSSIADRKISLNKLGTLPELAAAIEATAGITVQVDFESSTVRFLPKLAPQPEFTAPLAEQEGLVTSKVLGNEVRHEHQSDN